MTFLLYKTLGTWTFLSCTKRSELEISYTEKIYWKIFNFSDLFYIAKRITESQSNWIFGVYIKRENNSKRKLQELQNYPFRHI